MRAARVLDMLLALQRRGRMTARELAETLEVSERTILRDAQGLSEAGVPIVTVQGAGGGIELMDGFQTRLTGLTTDEAVSLFLVGQPAVAHRLGLGAPTRSARNKLLVALPLPLAAAADALATWYLHDPDPWLGNHIPHGELRRLATSIRQHRTIEVTMGAGPASPTRPLGLVLKAGSWYLITTVDDTLRILCIDDLRALRFTNRFFTPPQGFNLAASWAVYVDQCAATTSDAPAGSAAGTSLRTADDLATAGRSTG